MKKKLMNIGVVSMLTLLTSCSVSTPFLTTDNAAEKRGTASYKVILGIRPAVADISIKQAAKNGGITKVATVDLKVESKLFSTKYTTIVTGE